MSSSQTSATLSTERCRSRKSHLAAWFPQPFQHLTTRLKKSFAEAVDVAGRRLADNEIDRALKRILKYSNYMNQYFQASAPWANKDTAGTTLYVAVNAGRGLAVLLEPFIPFSCEKIWSQLNLSGSVHQQTWESAKDINAVPAGHELGRVEPIFRKIEAKEIEQWKSKLGKT